MAPTITIELPHERMVKEDCMGDEYLINQMDGVNDNPEEDNLPLRQWLIREAHTALIKNPKMTEIVLRPKSDKSSRTEFEIKIIRAE